MKNKILLIMLAIFFLTSFVSAAHYIVGNVNDALNGEPANGKIVTLWNPSNGLSDNLTDIVGPEGNSNTDNTYFIDCEMLQSPCQIGDTISVQIFNNGSNYVSNQKNVTITGAGYDVAENLSLNSPPNTTVIFPIQNSNNSAQININCSLEDADDDLTNISLWANFTGEWKLNETKTLIGYETWKNFIKILATGTYKIACFVMDSFGIGKFSSSNTTFFVDSENPVIEGIVINETDACRKDYVRANCTTYDAETSIDKVIIQSISPSGIKENHTTQFIGPKSYYADILMNTTGDWKFNCIANDSVGNSANLTSTTFRTYSDKPDLKIINSKIFKDKDPSIENEIINITSEIENQGCVDANNFVVGFFEGEKDAGGENYQNKTTSVQAKTSKNISSNWSAKIGPTNIFIYADLNNEINEENESDNEGNISLTLTAWQEVYGNVGVDKILANSGNNNLSTWDDEKSITGNIFVTDSELNVDWTNLQAIGKTKGDTDSSNDFAEIDSILKMSNFEDSVLNTFTNSGIPKMLKNFSVFQKNIINVPSINSTNNTNFITGILWDKSDSSDDEYDSSEKEDLIFITEINKSKQGKYGIYDYEIRVPAKLREYNESESSKLYYYYELN